MLPDDRNSAYLWDIIDAAETIISFTSGLGLHDYINDRKLQLAIERCLEIIGEASKRVTEEFKQDHTEIPWKAMIGQRNVLAHEYGDIKQERIWIVVKDHIPELINKLKPLIPPLPPPKQTEK